MEGQAKIKGYDYGSGTIEQSPISMKDLELIRKTLMWSDQDDKNLVKAGHILEDQTDDILDLWYDYVGSNPHLINYFETHGKPNEDYLNAVRLRFKQWILDLCNKSYDQEWLDYQYEIAKRHHSLKKNETDGVDAPPIIHLRYMIAFIYPITATIKSFLAKKGHSQDEVEQMYDSWFKAVTLTATLWSQPYAHSGQF